ncbi:MAG TPA: DUF3943 domain-containing protein, partial [Methylotenera sp.]|nr:DUF3943 domain-containing protein [Methylotenera sp.]
MRIKNAGVRSSIVRFQRLDYIKSAIIIALVTLNTTTVGIAFADDSVVTTEPAAKPSGSNAKIDFSSDRQTNKSYLIPALEIVGFDFLLNQFNRHYSGVSDYDSNLSTIRHNLKSSWDVDRDAFKINQLGHPYQGSMYHGFARSAGLGYWESLGYDLAGSYFWEIAGEKTPPSKNDMISTGLGGSFLGESLFRMSNIILEKGGSKPSFWREIGAAAISPPTGFNRYAFEDRFDAVFNRNDAAYYSRLQIGIANTIKSDPGTSAELKRNDAQVDFSMDYGL